MEAAACRFLRGLIGASLILAACLKMVSVADPAFRRTIIWRLCGGNELLVLSLACAEIALGALFVLNIWSRMVARLLVVMLGLFTVALLFRSLGSGGGACGCYGRLQLPLWLSIGHNIALVVGTIYVALMAERCVSARD